MCVKSGCKESKYDHSLHNANNVYMYMGLFWVQLILYNYTEFLIIRL